MTKFNKNEDGSITYKNVRIYKSGRAFAFNNVDSNPWICDTRDEAFRYIDRILNWHTEAVAYLAANPTRPEKSELAAQWEEAQAEFSRVGSKMNTSYGNWSNLSYDVTPEKMADAKDHIAMVIENAQAVEAARQKLEDLMKTTAEADFNEWRSNTYRFNDAQRHQTLTLELVK